MIAQKKLVRITLDVECYDDLDLTKINWEKLLELEGDENVHAKIQDYHELFWTWQFKNRHKNPHNRGFFYMIDRSQTTDSDLWKLFPIM